MLNRAAENLESILKGEFAPFPKWGDPAWQNLSEEARVYIISAAEPLMNKDWPCLPASRYMDYQRNGNRSDYETVYFERRDRLFLMVAAECAEGKGRFIDAIIDGMWAICEETSWIIPAHNNHYLRTKHYLPNFNLEYPIIDLFSAETGSMMSWIYYLMGDRLAQESDLLPARLEKEIKRRILDPFLHYDTMNWMGLSHKYPVNNWNPWINSNVLTAILLVEKDEMRRVQAVRKIARCAQRFLDFYAEDGGCDEGPSYFNAAGASMLDVLELLYDATDGKLSVYDQPLIGNMADYIRHVHIEGAYYVNFADAPCSIGSVAAGCLIRAARLTGKEKLADFAREMYRDNLAAKPWELSIGHCWMLFRKLKTLFTYEESDFAPLSPVTGDGHYFPGIQVATARTQGGLFFAAKGGHNAESHNHNDIGSYIVYANGEPCAIDAGVGRYSRKTFSEERYTIWSMQSGYHNTVIVNGCDQKNGNEYAAHSVSFTDDGTCARFALHIEKAYTEDAKLNAYRREFTLNRAENALLVTDSVEMSECTQAVKLPVMCYLPPVIDEGEVRINGITLHFDPALFTASFEEISLDDPENPITCWKKNTLYRLLLTRTEKKNVDSWTISYTLN